MEIISRQAILCDCRTFFRYDDSDVDVKYDLRPPKTETQPKANYLWEKYFVCCPECSKRIHIDTKRYIKNLDLDTLKKVVKDVARDHMWDAEIGFMKQLFAKFPHKDIKEILDQSPYGFSSIFLRNEDE